MKKTTIITLLVCIFTFLNTLLVLVSKIYDRKAFVATINDDKTVSLLKAEQKTENL